MQSTDTVDHASLVGTEIGNYRLTRPIGQGGMGSVFEAVHTQLGRRVAIKVMNAEFASDREALTRLFNEARAVNLIEHPGLVQISEFGQLPDGSAYLVMELLRGDTLSARLRRSGGKLGEKAAISVASQLASVLMAAHEKGIIHRDLKPSNVMLIPDPMVQGGERVKLLDFGIAKLNQSMGSANDPQTRMGTLLGTPRYMSPEQCRGLRDIDGKADVYALGVMLYEMLAGRMPFDAPSDVALLAAHMYEEPKPLREVGPNVSIVICSLVDQMLKKKKDDRPSMMEIAKAISERQTHHVEEQATARIGSIPDKEILRAMISVGAVPPASPPSGALPRLGPPPAPPSVPPSIPGAPRMPTPPSLAALSGSSGSLSAIDASQSGAGMMGLPDPTHPTTLRGSTGQQAPAATSRRGQIIVAAGLFTLLGVGVGALLLARSGDAPSGAAVARGPSDPSRTANSGGAGSSSATSHPTGGPAEKAAVRRVHWSITSEPTGADVIRASDGKVLGTTPFQSENDSGAGTEGFTLRLAGYRDAAVTVPRDRDVSVEKALQAIPPPPPEPQPDPAPPTKTPPTRKPGGKSKPAKKPAAKTPTKKVGVF